MIVGFCRKEKGGGERAGPRKLLSISSSRGSVTLSRPPPRGVKLLFSSQPFRYATCQTIVAYYFHIATVRTSERFAIGENTRN